MVDIDELERLLAAATPGEWATEFDPIDTGDHATAVCLPGKVGEIGTFLAYCQHNWNDADYSERRISWKEATTNAALIVAARNSLPAILTEIRELRAENARLKGHWSALDKALADSIIETDQPHRVRWEGEWHYGPLADAYFAMIGAVRDCARAALGEPQ